MITWLYENGQRDDQPEAYWPIRKIRPRQLARVLLTLDPSLIIREGADDDVELHYPVEQVGMSLYIHTRGVIVTFPFFGGALARVVLGITYTYVRYLSDQAGFWSFDPHLNVLSYGEDFHNIDETAALMESALPKLLEG
ncbi:MAG: hypothetical protein SGI73_16885 [Chloroflexota bacterium]|nr:hypothetical protein [Chloroflexota bacterium]